MKIWITQKYFFYLVVISCIIIGISIHTIEEGTVGIYYINGRLSDTVTEPGVHTLAPGITRVERIKIRPQTQTLEGIKTVTRDGIENHFEGIQVISKVEKSELINLVKKYGLEFRDALIHDRIKEELLGYCSNHTIDEVCKKIHQVLESISL